MTIKVMQKFHAYNTQFYLIFINFRQAFDSLNRQTILKDVCRMGILQNIKTNIDDNEEFTVKVIIPEGLRKAIRLPDNVVSLC